MPQPTESTGNIEALAACEVDHPDGTRRRLGELWRDRPAALFFVRHFGCLSCSLQLADLGPRCHELDDLQVRPVLVGHGDMARLQAFRDRFHLDRTGLVTVSDPSQRAYAAAGMVRSWWGAAGPRALLDYVEGFAAGHRNPGIFGDPAQQGGALLVDEAGAVHFHRANQRVGDITPTHALMDAALALAARRTLAGQEAP